MLVFLIAILFQKGLHLRKSNAETEPRVIRDKLS